MGKSLGDALIEEIERVQELIILYESVPNGIYAATMMKKNVLDAEKAMLEGDLPKMISAYDNLKTWKDQ